MRRTIQFAEICEVGQCNQRIAKHQRIIGALQHILTPAVILTGVRIGAKHAASVRGPDKRHIRHSHAVNGTGTEPQQRIMSGHDRRVCEIEQAIARRQDCEIGGRATQ